MAIYQYRCPHHGAFDATLVLGSAPASRACPGCGREAPRVWSVAGTVRSDGPIGAVLARAERPRTGPEVVPAPPAPSSGRPSRQAPTPASTRPPRP